MKSTTKWYSTACVSMVGLLLSQVSIAHDERNDLKSCVNKLAMFCDNASKIIDKSKNTKKYSEIGWRKTRGGH